MEEIVKYEGVTAVRRAKLVNSFNDGYRGYRRTYRTCTESASLAIARFTEEGSQLAAALAKPQQYVNRQPLAIEQSKPAGEDGKPQSSQEGPAKPDAVKPDAAKQAAQQPGAEPGKPGKRKKKGAAEAQPQPG